MKLLSRFRPPPGPSSQELVEETAKAVVVEFQRLGIEAEYRPLLAGGYQPPVVAVNGTKAYCLSIDHRKKRGRLGVHFSTLAVLQTWATVVATDLIKKQAVGKEIVLVNVTPVIVTNAAWYESTAAMAEVLGIVRVDLEPTPANAEAIVAAILGSGNPS